MDLFMVVVVVYVVLIYMPVDWVLGAEISCIRWQRRGMVRDAIVRTVRFRVVRVGDVWVVQGKALWLTPWRGIRLCKLGAYRTQCEAEEMIKRVEGEIRNWLKG